MAHPPRKAQARKTKADKRGCKAYIWGYLAVNDTHGAGAADDKKPHK